MKTAKDIISGIGIGYWFRCEAKYWVLGAYCGIVLTLIMGFYGFLTYKFIASLFAL